VPQSTATHSGPMPTLPSARRPGDPLFGRKLTSSAPLGLGSIGANSAIDLAPAGIRLMYQGPRRILLEKHFLSASPMLYNLWRNDTPPHGRDGWSWKDRDDGS
jgi:hypothetical protein